MEDYGNLHPTQRSQVIEWHHELSVILGQLHGVELLEYYDNGWLKDSDKARNEHKRSLIRRAKDLSQKIKNFNANI